MSMQMAREHTEEGSEPEPELDRTTSKGNARKQTSSERWRPTVKSSQEDKTVVHPVPFHEGREKCTTGVAQEQQRTRSRAEKRPLFGKRTVIMPGGAARGRRRISLWTTPSTTWANSPLPTPGRVDSINARISSGGCGPSRESKVGEQELIHPALRNAATGG